MNRTSLIAGGIVLIVAAAVGAAMVAGVSPTSAVVNGVTDGEPTDDDRETTVVTTSRTTTTGESTTTADGTTVDDGSSATTTTETTTADPPFAFAIERIQECGTTCRDVTVTLENRQADAATGVTVTTRIWAGNTTDDDPVWTGREDVGRLGSGERYTTTERVELSYSDGYAIERADGWVTVEVTIETDDRSITVTERRNVL